MTLQPSTAGLHTYSGEPLAIVGQAEVQVQYGEQELQLPLIIVGGKGPNLFALVETGSQEVNSTGRKSTLSREAH